MQIEGGEGGESTGCRDERGGWEGGRDRKGGKRGKERAGGGLLVLEALEARSSSLLHQKTDGRRLTFAIEFRC